MALNRVLKNTTITKKRLLSAKKVVPDTMCAKHKKVNHREDHEVVQIIIMNGKYLEKKQNVYDKKQSRKNKGVFKKNTQLFKVSNHIQHKTEKQKKTWPVKEHGKQLLNSSFKLYTNGSSCISQMGSTVSKKTLLLVK